MMKFAIVGGLAALALIFLIAAAATPWATAMSPTNGGKATVTYTWQKFTKCLNEVCVELSWSDVNKAANGKCGKAVNNTRAAMAFVILTILITVAGAVLGFAGAVVKSKDLPKFGGFALAGAALSCLIGWAITISLYTEIQCDTEDKPVKDLDYHNMGPSAPLQIVAWLFLISGAVAGIVLPSAGNKEAEIPLPSAGGSSKMIPAKNKDPE